MTYTGSQNLARMLISCPDQPGVVATVSRFLYDYGANIIHSDQHSTDPWGGLFFMRIEFELPNLTEQFEQLIQSFESIADKFQMKWQLTQASRKKRLAIFVTKEDHCLLELLWQWNAGDLNAELVMVVSNHDHMRDIVEPFGIPYYLIPTSQENKKEVEMRQMELVEEQQIDLVVLARYMQIIPPAFIEKYENRMINIHHSFLPAFVGGKPYAQAYERGVKLIGATAHYVTAELDGGPIIEQDVQRVTHKENVDELKRMGRHIERVVLARAVKWHIEDRILVHKNKTVVFD